MSQRDYFEKDYYATLGLDKSASSEEIAKTYRRLARQLHPDANPDNPEAEARFKEVGEAYTVLRNAEKRAEYDKVRDMVGAGVGAPGFGSPGGGGFPGGGFPGGARTTGGEAFDLNDILGGLFGAGAGQRSPYTRGASGTSSTGTRRGRDAEASITLSFEDAFAGATTTLRVYGRGLCGTCAGTGARPGTSPVTCATCGGTGSLAQNQGMFSFSETCPTCGGFGKTVPDPCPACDGAGTELRSREIRARIPAGVADGARIRLKGKGEPGRGGAPAGDLIVTVSVTPHELFDRRGADLHLRVPVTFAEAALGTKITVPTLDGPVTLKIPAGTEPGKMLRVRGRGVPRGGRSSGGRGDLLVTIDVRVPPKLSRTQRKMIDEFGATEDPDALRGHFAEFMNAEA
jgi:molecular chaperone DnaJ